MRSVAGLNVRERANGICIKYARVFDFLDSDGSVHRDALLIADVYRQQRHEGGFVGRASTSDIIDKASVKTLRDGYTTLQTIGDRYIDSLRAPDVAVDDSLEWFPVLKVLEDKAFLSGWRWNGKDHRWQGDAPAPWRNEEQKNEVDYLDLVRYLFARYWSGLPVRFRWSPQAHQWFLPEDQRVVSWRLWPYPL